MSPRKCACVAVVVSFICLAAVNAHPRTIDLNFDYYVASTVLHEFNPDLQPDMDGDAQPDLEGQANIDLLLGVLADPLHPDHGPTLATFEFNETVADTALETRFPNQALVPYLAELWAVYMTFQGPGAFQGPTDTGMRGRVESLWQYLQVETVAGAFGEQAWQLAEMFGGSNPVQASIVVTGGGMVYRGDRVVMSVTPVNALAYVWYKDAAALPGPGASTLVLDPVALDDAGDYYCEITTADKAILQTPTIALSVNEPPSVPIGGAGVCLGILAALIVVFGRLTDRKHISRS